MDSVSLFLLFGMPCRGVGVYPVHWVTELQTPCVSDSGTSGLRRLGLCQSGLRNPHIWTGGFTEPLSLELLDSVSLLLHAESGCWRVSGSLVDRVTDFANPNSGTPGFRHAGRLYIQLCMFFWPGSGRFSAHCDRVTDYVSPGLRDFRNPGSWGLLV